MRRTATLEEAAQSQPPRPRSVNAGLFMIVWIATFQTTGRSILMTRYFLYGADEGSRRALDHDLFAVAAEVFTGVASVAFCLFLAFVALKQLTRRTRLVSERVFYICLLILAVGGVLTFFWPRVPLHVSLAVGWIFAALSWIATGASIVLIWRRRKWEAYVEARARHRRTRKAVACAHEAEH